MVTIYKDENDRLQWDSTYTQLELRGLSDDDKPTTIEGKTIANGSVFIEIDTGKVFMYDLSTQTWKEV